IARLERVRALVEPAAAIGIAEILVGAAERALRLLDIDVRPGQLVNEARRNGGLVEPTIAPVLRERNLRPALGARKPDIGKPAFFLEPGLSAFIERALMRKQAFLPAGKKHGFE